MNLKQLINGTHRADARKAAGAAAPRALPPGEAARPDPVMAQYDAFLAGGPVDVYKPSPAAQAHLDAAKNGRWINPSTEKFEAAPRRASEADE